MHNPYSENALASASLLGADKPVNTNYVLLRKTESDIVARVRIGKPNSKTLCILSQRRSLFMWRTSALFAKIKQPPGTEVHHIICVPLLQISNPMRIVGERSGSVVECLNGNRGAAGSSLTGVIALCP